MDAQQFIAEAVRQCYWEKDVNCARTVLHTLESLNVAVGFLTQQEDLRFVPAELPPYPVAR